MPFKPLESGEGQGARGRSGADFGVPVPPRAAWLTAMLCLEVLLVAVFQTPFLRFDRFAFMDSGGELAIQDLMRRGYRPALDFGYLYGLLPLLLGRLWYGLAGPSPQSFRVQMLACMMLSAWGLARFAVARRLSPAGVVLITLAIPDLLLASYITLVQTLEPALLINALAEQARGRHNLPRAIDGLLLREAIAGVRAGPGCRDRDRRGQRPGIRAASVRPFGPALVTAAVLALILTLGFGAEPLAKTIFPFTGMAVYRISNYGFFHGVGREFWMLPHAGIRDYLRYEVGFWMLGTAVLLWWGLAGLRRLARGDSTGDRALRDEIIATCAAVHLGFVVLLFGHRGTWFYSLPMLILGLATLAAGGPRTTLRPLAARRLAACQRPFEGRGNRPQVEDGIPRRGDAEPVGRRGGAGRVGTGPGTDARQATCLARDVRRSRPADPGLRPA